MHALDRRTAGPVPAVGLLALLALGCALAAACGGSSPTELGNPTGGSGAGSTRGTSGASGTSSPSGANSGASSGDGSGGGSGSSGAGTSGSTGGSGSTAGSGATASSGSKGSSGTSSSGSSSSGSVSSAGGPTPTMLPTAKGTCPMLMSGSSQSISLNGKSMPWSMSVGTKASSPTGPIIIYWHGTGTSGTESAWGLGNAAIAEVTSLGGVVAAAESTSNTGTNTGDGVWFTGDVDFADLIIACAIQQLNIDTRRIYVAGYSAGALQTGYMYYARSGYLASAVVYSGGSFGGQFQDSSNVPPLIGAHGAASSSMNSGDFLAGSTTMFEQAVKAAGAPIVIDCDDGGAHTDITRLTRLGPSAWQFFKDHPFKQGKPDPYAKGLPSGFPSYCKIQ